MKTSSLSGLKRNLVFVALLALSSPALLAQTAPLSSPTAPPSSDALASMNQDVQSLLREVADLRLQVESLRQDNEDLKKKVLSQDEVKVTVANMLAASRAEINQDIDRKLAQAGEASRKDILDEVAKEMKALADDTNIQLEKLAHAIGNAPAPRPVNVTSAPSTPPKFDKGIDYVVKHGDTLAKICSSNHVTSRDLLLANPQLNNNPNLIREGQHLFIPEKDAPPALNLAPAATSTSGN